MTMPRIGSREDAKETSKIDTSSVLNARLDQIAALVRDGFARLDANDSLLRGEVHSLSIRYSDLEARVSRQSERVHGESKANLEQDAAIARIANEVDEIKQETAKQTAMLVKLTEGATKVLANPIVRTIATMTGTAILTWLAAHGGVR